MRIKWTNTFPCLLAICFMSGLVACGSLIHCLNSGLVAAACGGGYVYSDSSSVSQPLASSAEGLWMGTTHTGRTISAFVFNDDSYWVFYTTVGKPNVLTGLIQGTGTSHSGSFGSSNTKDFSLEGAGFARRR